MNEPTLEELNEIQRQWMALSSEAPKAEQQRVFALLKKYPRAHLSVSSDGKMAMPMIDSMPAWASSQPIERALEWIKALPTVTARVDVAWCGSKGQWVKL